MSLLRNSSIVVAGIIIANLLAFVFHIYVARSLGPADYGIFGALMSLYLLVALPAGAISSAITKFTAKYNAKKEFAKISLLRKTLAKRIWLIGAFLFLLIVLLSREIANYLNISSNIPVIIVGFTLIFALVLPINRGILQGMKKFKAFSLNNVYESVVRLALAFILIYFGFKVNGALLAYGLAYLIAFLLIFPSIKEIRKTNKNTKNTKIELKKIYKFILLVLFVNIILQAIINLPSIFIQHFTSSEFTGYWTAALNLARISLFATGGIVIVLFPEVSEKDNHEDKRKIFKKSLLLTLMTSIAIAIIFFILGDLAISILYGAAYLPASPILSWMGLAMIPLGVLQLWASYWLAKR